MTSETIFQTDDFASPNNAGIALLEPPAAEEPEFGGETPSESEPERALTEPLPANVDSPGEVPAVTPQPNSGGVRKPMQVRQFIRGFFITGGGLGLMLVVIVGVLRDLGVEGRLSLPVTAVCMVLGLMMLGGGFGLMATAAPGFDDDEFDRLLTEPIRRDHHYGGKTPQDGEEAA